MPYHRDLRDHIKVLEENNKLVRIKRVINKDTELMPLVRWEFRGLPEKERKAFLFENVVDAKGKRYSMPVLVASHAASKEVYALGMMCDPNDIRAKWAEAHLHPFKPIMVEDGPVHEEVHMGDGLLEHGGLDEIPVPISTPGFDNAPYFSCGCWVSKDPETGARNIGVYRAMIKGSTRTGINAPPDKHLRYHWEKCRRLGIPLQAAVIIGATPAIGFAGVTQVPENVDEYDIAGGIAGGPIPLVKCKTVDLEVPAGAEIVIEGFLPTDSMEREAPFGEWTGYMGTEVKSPYFIVTCITHRKNPIYNAFLSQFPPSESSKIRQISGEATLYKYLRHDFGLPVVDVALHESAGGGGPYCVISLKMSHPSQAWQALHGAVGLTPWRKIVVAVDDDIDPRDPTSVEWAIASRIQPHRDVRIAPGQVAQLDRSAGPPEAKIDESRYPSPSGASALLIDATRKWPYPPVSLPAKEYMEAALEIWKEEGLPELNILAPWHGYNLGLWSKENEEEAALAVKGEYYQTGEKLATQRINL